MPGGRAHPARDPGGAATDVRLISRVSPRVSAYAWLGGLALFGGLAFGRLELTVLAVPFLLAIVSGGLLAREQAVQVSTTVNRTRLLEGEEAVVEVTLRTGSPLPLQPGGRPTVAVTLDLPPEAAMVGRPIQRASLGGEPVTL